MKKKIWIAVLMIIFIGAGGFFGYPEVKNEYHRSLKVQFTQGCLVGRRKQKKEDSAKIAKIAAYADSLRNALPVHQQPKKPRHASVQKPYHSPYDVNFDTNGNRIVKKDK